MKHLFFEPTISNFQAISQNGKIVNSDDRKLISNDTKNPSTFLGVKGCIDYVDNNQNQAKDIFLVKHENAYLLAKRLYEEISGFPVTNEFHSNTNNMDWALFLVSSSTSIDKIDTSDSNDNKTHFNIIDKPLFEESQFVRKTEQIFDNEEISILENFDLIIGVQNGYDNDDEITFYATIKHKHYERGSFLTIGSYKFPLSLKIEYLKNNKDIQILLKDIKTNAAAELKKEIEAFKKLYTNLYNVSWTTISNDFLAVCLDVLNFNRSIESIKNDRDLKGDINLTRESSNYFLNLKINRGRQEFVMLLDYVIFSNHFDLTAFQYNRKKTEQVFVQKRSYKTISKRIMSVVQNRGKISDYLKEQNETYAKILPFLK